MVKLISNFQHIIWGSIAWFTNLVEIMDLALIRVPDSVLNQ